MPPPVFQRVEGLLSQHGITFQVLRHEPVYTSEQAARVRGTLLASGAKALICKGETTFIMFVLPADRKLDSHAVRRAKGWRKLRFATRKAGMTSPFILLTGGTGYVGGRLLPLLEQRELRLRRLARPWRGLAGR